MNIPYTFSHQLHTGFIFGKYGVCDKNFHFEHQTFLRLGGEDESLHGHRTRQRHLVSAIALMKLFTVKGDPLKYTELFVCIKNNRGKILERIDIINDVGPIASCLHLSLFRGF